MNKPELHLFIVWNAWIKKSKEIYDDINKNFPINKKISIFWNDEIYLDNLIRFYYLNTQIIIKNKLQHIWKWEFEVILVIDEHPKYELRKTTSGKNMVNSNMFDLKKEYRLITWGGHKIHGTDNVFEAKYQLFLLLWIEYNKLKQSLIKQNFSTDSHFNPIYSFELSDLDKVFDVLNTFSEYVILRNFENIDKNYYDPIHNDIDILTNSKDFALIKSLLNLKKVFHEKCRRRYKLYINNKIIYFDFRLIGDNYYDINWEKQILKERKKYKNFYVPEEKNLKYSLLYHALVHKKIISSDYSGKFESLFGTKNIEKLFLELSNFMRNQWYSFVESSDYSVSCNYENIKKYTWSIVKKSMLRKINYLRRKLYIVCKIIITSSPKQVLKEYIRKMK